MWLLLPLNNQIHPFVSCHPSPSASIQLRSPYIAVAASTRVLSLHFSFLMRSSSITPSEENFNKYLLNEFNKGTRFQREGNCQHKG